MNQLLRQAWIARSKTTGHELDLTGWDAELQRGVDTLDRDELLDLMDGRRAMQAVDTNVLVHAEVRASPHHARALRVRRSLAEGNRTWAIPWPCVHEFLRVVTHPRVFHPAVPTVIAVVDLGKIRSSPTLLLSSGTASPLEILERVLAESGASSNPVHDAHIAALRLEHDVAELITGDRDLARFSSLRCIDPFVRAGLDRSRCVSCVQPPVGFVAW